jgi:hypothetical protein
LEAIGGVWTEKEKLRVNVSVAADTYHSLIMCFASNHFREIRLEVRNLRYTQGSLYRISFDPEETPREDMYALNREATTKEFIEHMY